MGNRHGPAPTPVGPLAPWMAGRLRRLMRRKRGRADVALRARMIYMLAGDPCVHGVADILEVDPKTVRLLWVPEIMAGPVPETLAGSP